MKNRSILPLLLMLAFAACTKKNDVAPDAGTSVAGTYQVSYIRLDSATLKGPEFTLPIVVGGQTVLSGTVITKRVTATSDSLKITLKQPGQQDDVLDFGVVDLKTSGTSYDMYLGSLKVGTTDGTNVNIDAQDTDAQNRPTYRYVINAKR